MGHELKWRKVAEGLTRAEALRLEHKTILDLLRDGKPLANMLHRSLFDLKHDSADDIVVAIVGNVSAHKAESIGKGLLAQLKRQRQQPAG